MDAITAINQRTSVRRFRPDPVRGRLSSGCSTARCAPRTTSSPSPGASPCSPAAPRIGSPRSGRSTGSSGIADPATPEALAGADKVRRESRETPVYIVAMAAVNPDEITREEDYAATMMAIANLMIAAESLGLGTYLKSGGVMQDPELLELAEVPDKFRVVGLISLGYPAEQDPPRRRKPAAELTRWVDELREAEQRVSAGPKQLFQLDRVSYRVPLPVVVEVHVDLLARAS